MRSSTPWALTWYIINLNMIFYTHVKHSPTKTIYISYYTKNNNNKNALQTHSHTYTHARTHARMHARTHARIVAVVKPCEDIGSNKSLGCVFSEKPADWTNAFKLEISSLADFYDELLHGQFWVKNESKIPVRIREGDAVRAESNRIREGNGRFQVRRKGKEKSFCFVRWHLH